MWALLMIPESLYNSIRFHQRKIYTVYIPNHFYNDDFILISKFQFVYTLVRREHYYNNHKMHGMSTKTLFAHRRTRDIKMPFLCTQAI